MAAVNGNTILMKIGTDTIGSQKGVSFESSAEMLDISDKTDEDAVFIPGKRTDTVSLSSFYVVADTAQAAMRTAYEANTAVTLFWAEGGTNLKTNITSYISSLSVSAPEHGPAETEVSLQVSGGWSAA
jgi:hypothetical protein